MAGGSDRLWKRLDVLGWEMTRNPWWLLQCVSQERLEELATDQQFKKELNHMVASRQEYLNQPGWFRQNYLQEALGCIVYFNMEFGVGEAVPLYSGGLGILAGDHLKTASDLDIPLVGVGLLYQEGYFHQILADDGTQIAANPHNDPTNLPMRPVSNASGGWLSIPLELPGRTLLLRVWQVQVGRVKLYLLDSNDPMNHPADRSVIYRLYDDEPEFRLAQEMALGIGGWRLLEALGIQAEVCHLNEGHAAFVVLERARSYMRKNALPFPVALWATRAGNVFTTHTPVAAGFDVFAPSLLTRYFGEYARHLGISMEQFLALGRQDPKNTEEPFNMATLATRGSTAVNAVSQLHREVSRHIFEPLYPRWPGREIPVGHVTNGVHVSSWQSKWADQLWAEIGGKNCWYQAPEALIAVMQDLTDEKLWSLRTQARQDLVSYVRQRLLFQFRQYVSDSQTLEQIRRVLDPNTLTLGFARRFATYKRPTLLLHDPARLKHILTSPKCPVQLVVAGKAHPKDESGRRLIQEMVQFARQPDVRHHMVFLPNYDIELAQQLVQGVDVWINTPRRPWEACGTSGMKVLVNGGLNLSEIDGWWAEAYKPDVGWALGDGQEHNDSAWDTIEANQLYELLEQQIVPQFYERDSRGIPLHWVNRIRSSMSQLAPRFSSNRMLRDYMEMVYMPAASRLRERMANNAQLATELHSWQMLLERHWSNLRFVRVEVHRENNRWVFKAEVYLDGLSPDAISVQIFADPSDSQEGVCQTMVVDSRTPSAPESYLFHGSVTSTRPAGHFAIRIIPAHAAACIPLEDNHILWWQ